MLHFIYCITWRFFIFFSPSTIPLKVERTHSRNTGAGTIHNKASITICKPSWTIARYTSIQFSEFCRATVWLIHSAARYALQKMRIACGADSNLLGALSGVFLTCRKLLVQFVCLAALVLVYRSACMAGSDWKTVVSCFCVRFADDLAEAKKKDARYIE